MKLSDYVFCLDQDDIGGHLIFVSSKAGWESKGCQDLEFDEQLKPAIESALDATASEVEPGIYEVMGCKDVAGKLRRAGMVADPEFHKYMVEEEFDEDEDDDDDLDDDDDDLDDDDDDDDDFDDDEEEY